MIFKQPIEISRVQVSINVQVEQNHGHYIVTFRAPQIDCVNVDQKWIFIILLSSRQKWINLELYPLANATSPIHVYIFVIKARSAPEFCSSIAIVMIDWTFPFKATSWNLSSNFMWSLNRKCFLWLAIGETKFDLKTTIILLFQLKMMRSLRIGDER